LLKADGNCGTWGTPGSRLENLGAGKKNLLFDATGLEKGGSSDESPQRRVDGRTEKPLSAALREVREKFIAGGGEEKGGQR